MQSTPLDTPRTATSSGLLEIIELKWLLRGHGLHVHVERMQTDAEYARRMLDHAAATPNPALRELALRLRRYLQLGD